MMGAYFSLSKLSWMNFFVFGSAGYPEPKSTLYFCLSLNISSSLLSFARIDAAPTIGWSRSALCSQERITFLFSRSFWTSCDHACIFTEGQSTIAFTCSVSFSVRWFMIWAVLIASR